ncbi:MAG: DNA-processing protein DprA [Candidatus Rifleibacteriota bacterium]
MSLNELKAAIKLSRMPGVGAVRFLKLMERLVKPSKAILHQQDKMAGRKVVPRQSRMKSRTEQQIMQTFQLLDEGVIEGWYYSQTAYPNTLKDLKEPPPVLFYSGKWPKGKMAAVVGARDIKENTGKIVEKTVKKLVESGYNIISGGARGVDALAHKWALKLNQPTIAVLANGLDITYPFENARLFAEIKSGKGALLTELLCGAQPRANFFPTRNRIIAGLSDLVVIVQAGRKSGTMITAKRALKLKRRILVAMPDAIKESGWEGSLGLIKEGAEPFDSALQL